MDYRPYRKVLQMVTELHVRGYQRLRIVPAMAPSGVYWRCAITPVTNISSRHGARLLSWDTLVAHYSTGQERNYFGWDDANRVTASRLAALFIARFPEIVDAGRGSDWVYAGWYHGLLLSRAFTRKKSPAAMAELLCISICKSLVHIFAAAAAVLAGFLLFLRPFGDEGSRIINPSSSTTALVLPGYAAYVATKGAVEQFSHVLAKELGPKNIAVKKTRGIHLGGQYP